MLLQILVEGMSKKRGKNKKRGTLFKGDKASKNIQVGEKAIKARAKKKKNLLNFNNFFEKIKQKINNEKKSNSIKKQEKFNGKILKKQRRLHIKKQKKKEKQMKKDRKKLEKKRARKKRREKKSSNLKQRKKKDQNLTNFHIENIKKIEHSIDNEINNKYNSLDSSTLLDLDVNTIINQIDTDVLGYQSSEFLELSPFDTDVKAKQITLEKMNLLETSIANSKGEFNVSQTKMKPLEKQETTIPKEDVSNISTKENFNEPLIDQAMTKNDDKKSSKKKIKDKPKRKYFYSGVTGFDNLLEKGIPTGANIIVAGGPGCGKTIFCLQTIYNLAAEGKDCVFLSMEERPDRLKGHMLSFGFKVEEIESSDEQIILRANGKGRISLKRLQPIRLARSIEALLEKASGTLPVDIDLVLDFIPEDFNATLLALDSISAIETAFSGTKRQYRIYIEQLFRYFEDMNLTTFMITESMEAPKRFSNTGVEEFLADGIFVFYNFQGVRKRSRGVEVFKLRGASHSQRIVPMEITSNGIKIDSDESCKNQAKT